MKTEARARARSATKQWGRKAAVVSVTAALAGLFSIPARPATAEDHPPTETQALCHVEVPLVTVTPGFSATPTTGTGQSAEGATIRCVGVVDGKHTVGDPGPIAVTFTYGNGPLSSLTTGDTCLAGYGDGVVTAVVPLIDGTHATLTGPIHFGFLGPVATFYGHFGEKVYAGIGEPVPDLGTLQDCITTPITRFSIRGQFGMKGGQGLPGLPDLHL